MKTGFFFCGVNAVQLSCAFVWECAQIYVRSHFDLWNMPEMHDKDPFSISILRSIEVIKNLRWA
jgi:hypothetical protein